MKIKRHIIQRISVSKNGKLTVKGVTYMQAMDCEKCRELLFDYVSDLTDETESRAVAEHIELCPECGRELEFIKTMLAAAAEIPEVPVPDEVREAVDFRLKAAEAEIKRERSGKFRRIVSAAVPIAAAAALTIGMYTGGVFDKLRSADEVMDGKPYAVTNGGAEKTENEDKASSAQTENYIESDTKSSTESNAESGAAADTNINSAPKQSAQRTNTEREAGGAAEVRKSEGSVNAENTESTKTENAETRNAKTSSAETVKEKVPVQNDAGEVGVNTAAPSDIAEDTQEKKSSVYAEPRAVGNAYGGSGGTAAVENDKAEAYGPMLMSEAYAEVPKSCEIVSGDASVYAGRYGAEVTEDGCSFAISAGEWEDLRSLAMNNGDTVNTGEFVSADSVDAISVTVTER